MDSSHIPLLVLDGNQKCGLALLSNNPAQSEMSPSQYHRNKSKRYIYIYVQIDLYAIYYIIIYIIYCPSQHDNGEYFVEDRETK